jgi:signal transduction histidine kinase/FixJ family two-component response regulator
MLRQHPALQSFSPSPVADSDGRALRVLLVEDSEEDAALVARELRRAGFTLMIERVETAAAMARALERGPWDVVLSDFALPTFDAHGALALVQRAGLDLPFIIVSGAIGEETAVAAMRAGAHDYVMKGNWSRLAPAIDRERREAVNRQERRLVEDALRLLAEASKDLGSSLSFEDVLQRLVQLVVPRLADWFVVDLIEPPLAPGDPPRVRRVAVETSGPRAEAAARLLWTDPPRWDSLQPTMQAVQTGQTVILTLEDDDLSPVLGMDGDLQTLVREEEIHTSLAVPLEARGRILGALLIARTGRRRALGPTDVALAEELARRGAMALDNARLYQDSQDAVRARNDLLAAVSHDLRSPLTSIRGHAQILLRQLARGRVPEPERLKETLTTFESLVQRMTGQLDEMLDLARLHTGEPLDLRLQRMDLVALVRGVVDDLRGVTPQCQIHFAAQVPSAPGYWDATRLERVVLNLVHNAIKYSPGGGAIAVSVAADPARPDWAEISVEDHGLGIPAADLPHIFNRFHRASNVGTIDGTGLGLAICRQIVEQHGGTITVASEVGQGSVFTVRLPLGEPG